jgi:hypothetical protein
MFSIVATIFVKRVNRSNPVQGTKTGKIARYFKPRYLDEKKRKTNLDK